MKETAILINVKDRPTELALLLQSLRTSTYQDFDIFILDDCSGSPLTNYHFFNCILNRLKLEGHKVFIRRTDFVHGVSRARQAIVDWALESDYQYFCRLDDDVVVEPDYLEKLMEGINQGYDLMSGLTIPMQVPTFKRTTKFVEPIIGYCEFDKEGNLTYNGDCCGSDYIEEKILLAPHFRSCALYKSSIHKKANYLPTRLSNHGFREENLLSWKIILAGFKIGVHTGAKTWHQITPSGGERPTQNMTQFNQKIFEEDTKELFNKHGDFLADYYKKHGIEPRKLHKLEYLKEDNLIRT